MVARRGLRSALLLLLARPVHVFMVARSRSFLASSAPALRARPLFAMEEEEAYRLLGIPEGAGYDEITNAFEDLSERYASEPARVATLEEAKDKVINIMLQRRMSGAAAQYSGGTAREDIKAPPKTPIWEIANAWRKRVIIIPTPKYALQVIGLMGGLALSAWVAPSTASTTALINTVSGMGFMYNRGEAEVVRDDFGQIGEIRPMKPRPFGLTVGIAAFVWILASIKTNKMMGAIAMATGSQAPKGLALIVRTTYVSLGLMIPALFVRVMGVFPED